MKIIIGRKPLLRGAKLELRKLGLYHQHAVANMRRNDRNDDVADCWGYVVLVVLFDGDPDKWIKALREKGRKEQLLNDLPFVFWVKEQSEYDSDFLNRVKHMVDETFTFR